MRTALTILVVAAFAMTARLGTDKVHALPVGNGLRYPIILHDPTIPSEGNPNGDLTIVEYFDYQCSPCKQVNSIIHQIVRDDGNIRLVFKDRPIFGDMSIYAARLGLAAKYQNKFSEAHDALISIQGKLSEQSVLAALVAAGIDVSRIQLDLSMHQTEINAILARNQGQASALGFEGTPAFLVETFRVPATFNTKDFPKFIAKARLTKRADERSFAAIVAR